MARADPPIAPEPAAASADTVGPAQRTVMSLGQILGCLYLIGVFFAPLVWLTSEVIYNWAPTPLPTSASASVFSEGRAMRHVVKLAGEIGDRQVPRLLAQWLMIDHNHMFRYKHKFSVHSVRNVWVPPTAVRPLFRYPHI